MIGKSPSRSEARLKFGSARMQTMVPDVYVRPGLMAAGTSNST